MQAILKTCMMRRHKDSVLNGQRLLNLPPKNTTEVNLDFSEEERAIYDQVEQRMKIKFGKFLKQGESYTLLISGHILTSFRDCAEEHVVCPHYVDASSTTHLSPLAASQKSW